MCILCVCSCVYVYVCICVYMRACAHFCVCVNLRMSSFASPVVYYHKPLFSIGISSSCIHPALVPSKR